MSVPIHLEMHCDHQHQLNELALWAEYLNHWRRELGTAVRDLDRLRESLECHEQALEEHCGALDRQRQQIDNHEHGLAEWERGGTEPGLISQAQQHKTEMTRQRELRETHERIKKHHHLLLAHWNMLCDAIARPV